METKHKREYAIIDVGSNSIRFWHPKAKNKLIVTTRLGEGLAATGVLSEINMKKSKSVITAMATNARHMGLVPVGYATSAVRDAENGRDFIDDVFLASGVRIEILSGEREAEYAFKAACENGCGLIDIGGASFQLVSENFKMSFPLGCVRGRDIALSRANAANCDENWQVQYEIIKARAFELMKDIQVPKLDGWIGVGGTITCLAAFKLKLKTFEPRFVDSAIITHEELIQLIRQLAALGNARKNDPMLIDRHDVILYGAAILDAIMTHMNIERVKISTRDGIEGYYDFITE